MYKLSWLNDNNCFIAVVLSGVALSNVLKNEIKCASEDSEYTDIDDDDSIYYGSFVTDDINDVIKEFIKIFNDCDILESTIIHKFSYDVHLS